MRSAFECGRKMPILSLSVYGFKLTIYKKKILQTLIILLIRLVYSMISKQKWLDLLIQYCWYDHRIKWKRESNFNRNCSEIIWIASGYRASILSYLFLDMWFLKIILDKYSPITSYMNRSCSVVFFLRNK